MRHGGPYHIVLSSHYLCHMSCHAFIVDFRLSARSFRRGSVGAHFECLDWEEEEEDHKEYSVLSFLFAVSVQRSPGEPLKHDFRVLYQGFIDPRDNRSARDALRSAHLL